LSTHEEIIEVFEQDIENKTRQVSNRFGTSPFYDYFADLMVKRILNGVMSSEDEDMITCLYNTIITQEQQRGD